VLSRRVRRGRTPADLRDIKLECWVDASSLVEDGRLKIPAGPLLRLNSKMAS
jgi:hypothetical protein